VEFRWHEGCLEYGEILAWVKFIHYFLAYAKRGVDVAEVLCNKAKDFDCLELIEIMRIKDDGVVQWVKDRYECYYK
jgi:hypothetical protein